MSFSSGDPLNGRSIVRSTPACLRKGQLVRDSSLIVTMRNFGISGRLSSLRTAAALLGLVLMSCSVFEVQPCSDLQIGEQLEVTIQAPLGNNPCDPALGLVSGAVIHLFVQEEGGTKTCTTMMGPATIPGIDLTYQSAQSADASGTDAFVSTSDVAFESCEGRLVLLLSVDPPMKGASDTFSKMLVAYYPVLDSECPRGCDLDYSVEVTRMQ